VVAGVGIAMASDQASSAAPRTAGRLLDVDRAKGLAILLVVFGHLLPKGESASPLWYEHLHSAIYRFHMPFFMYLSGFVFFLSGSQEALSAGFGRFIGKRAYRLLVPFVVFGLISYYGKYFAGQLHHMAFQPDGLFRGLPALLLNTNSSPVVSIWYIFVLFLFCVATPVLWRLCGRRFVVLLPIAVLVHFLPVTDDFFLDRAAGYWMFFLLGGVAALNWERTCALFSAARFVSLPIFIGALVLMTTVYADIPHALGTLVGGCLAIPALHQLMREPAFANDRIFLTLGKFSFIIYLLNTIVIGVGRLIWFHLVPNTEQMFLFYAIAMTAAGTIGPIVAKRLVLDRSPTLRQLTA
jgi:fucose 4-O-acetylase-like acetyltransferase